MSFSRSTIPTMQWSKQAIPNNSAEAETEEDQEDFEESENEESLEKPENCQKEPSAIDNYMMNFHKKCIWKKSCTYWQPS